MKIVAVAGLNSKFFGVPQNRERVFIIGCLRGQSRPEILPFRGEDKEANKQITSTAIDANYEAGIDNHEQRIAIIHNIYGGFKEDTPRLFTKYSPTIKTSSGGGSIPLVRTILTPDRLKKRQNGRRMKEEGEPMFTLTGQDIHGIMAVDIYNKKLRNECPILTDPCHNSIRLMENEYTIRKLTPIECERLQGFPDNWTKLGIDDKFNIVTISDTQRYKMCGNAVTTNVIQLLIEKIFKNENNNDK